MKEKVVLAYSGGLDTSIVIPWLKENYDMDIVAACINVGQDDDMEQVRKKAIESGAVEVYTEDVKEEFVKDYVFSAVKANAVYEDKYLMGTAVARPLIAKKLVEIAHKEGAKYICHGCTGKGNDQVRFEAGIASVDPTIKIIAPWRIWDISSREDAIDYAKSKGIEVPVTKEKIYSRDMNMMHISHEGGHLEDPSNEHRAEELYLMTKTLEEASDTPTYVELYFEKGEPKKLNGKEMSPAELLTELNKIGGENGIGIVDILENRLVGMKSRGVYETPGATILMEAHRDLERLTIDKDTAHYKQNVAIRYGELIYDGLWFSQLKESLDGFINVTQENVTGNIKMKLYKGNVMVAGMDSPYALYDEEISSFGASELYNHEDAEGFIKLFTLPLKIRGMAKEKAENNK